MAETDATGADKRQTGRRPALRAVKIGFAGSVVDCLVLDESESRIGVGTGMRIGMEAVVPLPEHVTVELRSGGVWNAERRWQRGLESGLMVTGFAGLNPDARARASSMSAALERAGVWAVMERLAEASHFESPPIIEACQAADVALRRLEHELRRAAGL